MTRPPSILSRVITASASSLAQRLQVPPANLQAFVSTTEAVLSAQWCSLFGGETVRVYAPRETQRQREERRERIVAAIERGESPRAIAKRESVSPSWVHRLAKVTSTGIEKSRSG